MDTYLKATNDLYKEAALTPDEGLCCTTTPIWQFPGLNFPVEMLKMNYGCGSTVNPSDLNPSSTVLYVGVGGGMELLQFSYFVRDNGSVIGIDVVDEMIDTCDQNLMEAERSNDWFKRDFIQLKKGDALHIPLEDESVDVTAQNCLFNIFKEMDLQKALEEMYRVLKPHGRLVLSDPVSEATMPESLKKDDKLRAMCLSGAIPLRDYIKVITDIGFGTVEVRARRPYRILDPKHYDTPVPVFLESVEICAIKDPMPEDGPCVFTGRSAIYFGGEPYFDDKKGHVLMSNQPIAVCDKTAAALSCLKRDDIFISSSSYFYNGGGCC